MPATREFMGVVLAGGASTRMGADKAFIEVDGAPMVARAAVALTAAGAAAVLAVGGHRARLEDLGLRAVPDLHPAEGPLGGVITALAALDSPLFGDWAAIEAVVTLPCDVIEPDAAAVRLVARGLSGRPGDPAGAAQGADLAVPLGAGAPQWMHAAWRRRCLPTLSEAFARGVRAPKEAAGLLRTVEVEIAGVRWFKDADRPEDLRGRAGPDLG